MNVAIRQLVAQVEAGQMLSAERAGALAAHDDLDTLMAIARSLRDAGHGAVVSYSPKVFIPLTRLCRDVCHYCTFAHSPQDGQPGFLGIEDAVAVARKGVAAGCHEALFTLGDKPELRYASAAAELAALGHETTLSYLAEAARQVHQQTGLLPHLNPGVLSRDDLIELRRVSVSMGIMLESSAERLGARGGPHYGSPDKAPSVRLQTIDEAGKLGIPFTTGILVGIGETRIERIRSLVALRRLHDAYGHIQEVIIQNFRPKPGTLMADAPAPTLRDFLWTIAVARLILGPAMNIQAPPNLSARHLRSLLDAGINDWGGISPVTPDHVNPEAPWPSLARLREVTDDAGKTLVPRLALYPKFALAPSTWLDTGFFTSVIRRIDAHGYARDSDWFAGQSASPPSGERTWLTPARTGRIDRDRGLAAILGAARDGKRLSVEQVVQLFQARGAQFDAVCSAADALRREASGDRIGYVVNRNINYTNVCTLHCGFCAFSKGRSGSNLRGRPYNLDHEEIGRRVGEAWQRGATEVCLQGGIHPDFTGETYLEICRTVKRVEPAMHVHAFSPQEIWHGAKTLGVTIRQFLAALKAAGLGSLPGTAAEILDDEVRAVICRDKLAAAQWLEVIEAAHETGLATTATIMFGHVDHALHWARHLLCLRDLQARTHGFTELVPLPFVHREAPLNLKGAVRRGPTFREVVLMHAVARLALHPEIVNVQVSWVKLGGAGAQACLVAGANDLGGTLMNESISRAAGASFGQELAPRAMEALIGGLGRTARPRTTLYADAPAERRRASFEAGPLAPTIDRPARKQYAQGHHP